MSAGAMGVSCGVAGPLGLRAVRGRRASAGSGASAGTGAGSAARGRQGRRTLVLSAAALPPTVSDTKAKFLEGYKKPIPAMYNSAVQELLVTQHLIRYNAAYKYDKVYALGFVHIYRRLMEGFRSAADDRDKIFDAYITALGEDPATYRKDADEVEAWAKGLNEDTMIASIGDATPVGTQLGDVKARSAAKTFLYSKFFAIGLLRALELAGCESPEKLDEMAQALGIPLTRINSDLGQYRVLMSKIEQAQEMFAEFLKREAQKNAERASGSAASSP